MINLINTPLVLITMQASLFIGYMLYMSECILIYCDILHVADLSYQLESVKCSIVSLCNKVHLNELLVFHIFDIQDYTYSNAI